MFTVFMFPVVGNINNADAQYGGMQSSQGGGAPSSFDDGLMGRSGMTGNHNGMQGNHGGMQGNHRGMSGNHGGMYGN
jgi:hypothetical protein